MGIIRTTFEIITEESAAEGDVADRGWKDETGTEYDVKETISLLRHTEPSNSHFHVGTWYTEYGSQDPFTGDVENTSYHLVEGTFTEDEERRIFAAITKGR